MARKKKWIQGAIENPGRVRAYLARIYGRRAFTADGNIRVDYLERAKRRAKRAGNTSLVHAINAAKTLKKLGR